MATDGAGEKVGGYEVELVNGTPTGIEVYCTVCTRVLRDPVQFKCCTKRGTKHLCGSCYKNFAQNSMLCPNCGTETPETFPDGAWSRIIQGLKVYCRNKQRGCYWENKLRLLSDHLSECSCEMIACPRMCGLSVERRSIDFHVDKICRLRPFRCEYCSLTGNFASIAGTHYNQCEEYPLKCTNQCSNETIKRKDMNLHVKDFCPLEELSCCFSEVGCEFKCQRKDMVNHLETSMQKHLIMTMETVHHLKLRVKALEEEQLL